jgi:hypothetical protein
MHSSAATLVMSIVLIGSQCQADDVIVSSKNRHGVIGSAYNSQQESLPGPECIKGTTMEVGTSSASPELKQTVDEQELAKELGLEVGGHARFGAYEASAEADFLNRSSSSAFSIGLTYRGEYLFAPRKLLSDGVQYTTTSQPLMDRKDFLTWPKVCGDSFVSELTKGARLFVSIRVEFKSSSEEQAFSQKFNLSGPMVGVNESLKQASKSFQKNVTVTVSALQIGGDVSKVTDLFGTSDTAANNFVKCSFGDFEKCSTVIENAIKYATNTSTGFPSQLKAGTLPGPVDISYVVTPYEAYNLGPRVPREAAQLALVSRTELSNKFEHTFWEFRQANSLLDLTTDRTRKAELTRIKQLVLSNLNAEHKAADVCFDTPDKCADIIEHLKLAEIDDEQLLPETFRTFCVESLQLAKSDPLRKTVDALVQMLSPSFVVNDKVDCVVYEQLLAKRKSMSLNGKAISNLLPLASFVKLQRLFLDGNDIEDIRPLATLTSLKGLSINSNKIRSVDVLSSMDQLFSLAASSNQISSIEPLQHLSLLHDLTISDNFLTGLKGVENMTRLVFIDAYGNNISDLGTLATGPPRLGCIDVRGNLINQAALDTLKQQHPNTIVVGPTGYARPNGWLRVEPNVIDFACAQSAPK